MEVSNLPVRQLDWSVDNNVVQVTTAYHTTFIDATTMEPAKAEAVARAEWTRHSCAIGVWHRTGMEVED